MSTCARVRPPNVHTHSTMRPSQRSFTQCIRAAARERHAPRRVRTWHALLIVFAVRGDMCSTQSIVNRSSCGIQSHRCMVAWFAAPMDYSMVYVAIHLSVRAPSRTQACARMHTCLCAPTDGHARLRTHRRARIRVPERTRSMHAYAHTHTTTHTHAHSHTLQCSVRLRARCCRCACAPGASGARARQVSEARVRASWWRRCCTP